MIRCLLPGLIMFVMGNAPFLKTLEIPSVNPDTENPVIIKEIRPGVWIHTTFFTYPDGTRFPSNGLLVKEGDGLVMIDTGWGEIITEGLLKKVDEEIGLPVRSAIITHSHYDRIAGADVLEKQGIEVWSLPLTQKRAVQEGMPVPNHTFKGLDKPGDAVRMGSIEVFYPGPAHTQDNLAVWLPKQKILFGGCAIRALSSHTLGNIADANIKTWPEAVRRMRSRYRADMVVPGHGKAGKEKLLDHTLDLLK